MRKGSHPKKHETQAKILHAAILLFLEKGYQAARTADISKKAGFTSTMFFSAFADKESVLYALIGVMFGSQFDVAERLLGEACSPVLLYSVETALQLHIAELSEALRDLYVTAYTLPTTSEYIYQKTAAKLEQIFKDYRKDCEAKDFYELEIASAGIVRGYMAKPCGMYFTMRQKISRFLDVALKVYDVPQDERQRAIQTVLRMDLHAVANELVCRVIKRAEAGRLLQDNEE